MERVSGNTYTCDFGGGPETVVADGTDQRTKLADSGTLSVGIHGESWTDVRKNNGHTILSALWRLSSDGNSLIDHFTAFNADNSPYTLNHVYKRKPVGSGFAGTWVSTSVEAVNYKAALQSGRSAKMDSPSWILERCCSTFAILRGVDAPPERPYARDNARDEQQEPDSVLAARVVRRSPNAVNCTLLFRRRRAVDFCVRSAIKLTAIAPMRRPRGEWTLNRQRHYRWNVVDPKLRMFVSALTRETDTV